MIGEEERIISDEISAVRKVCKIIRMVILVALVLFCAIVALFVGLLIVRSLDSASSVVLGSIGYVLLFGLDVAAILFIAARVFREAEQGHPFARKQVSRLRCISILFVVYALIECIFAVNFQGTASIGGFDIGVLGGDVSPTPSSFVNVGALLFAVAIYCVSFIFRYGSLLQEMSDDTV